MIETKTFDALGRKYRARQFAAVPAMKLLQQREDAHPLQLLATTEVQVGDAWVALDSAEAINEHVFDAYGLVPPRAALNGVMSIIRDFNFGFLLNWKGVSVPHRFRSETKGVDTAHIDPVISTLIGNDTAKLHELEERYSLQDAFIMFDVLMAKSVNQALSQEASIKSAKR